MFCWEFSSQNFDISIKPDVAIANILLWMYYIQNKNGDYDAVGFYFIHWVYTGE